MANNILDFKKICRTCLSNVGPMKDLFRVCSAEQFKSFTSLEASKEDNLPRKICKACVGVLQKTLEFKETATHSSEVLKQYLDEQHKVEVDIEIVEVKTEVYSHNTLSQSIATDSHGPSVPASSGTSGIPAELAKPVGKPDEAAVVPDAPKNTLDPAEIIRKIRSRRALTRKATRRPLIKCPVCQNKSFHKYEHFEVHMRNHFGKKPDVRCLDCNKSFSNLRNLNSHLRIHSGEKKYQCKTCGKNFAYLNVLKNHEMIHAGVKKYVCDICDAKFVQKHNMKTHLKTHINEQNYICGQCGKKFSQSGNLKTHMIRHTGIKNIACELCDKRFYIKSDLIKHLRAHSEDKPFQCEYCDKAFKTQSFKIIHMRSHTGERPYACDLCTKRFRAPKELRNHRMTHTGERPYKCTLCAQAFIQKCGLNRHMKAHMKAEEENERKSSDSETPQPCVFVYTVKGLLHSA